MENSSPNNFIQERETRILHKIRILERNIIWYTRATWAQVILGALVSIVGLVFFFENKLTLNELGDYWAGSVMSLWTLAGMFFIYVAFLGQKQQLYYQQLEIIYNREEMKAAREELDEQHQEISRQNQILSFQRFENTFFQMFGMLGNIINSLNLQLADNRQINGIDVIRYKAKQCIGLFAEHKTLEALQSAMEPHEAKLLSHCEHYVSFLTQIFEFIDNANLDDSSRYIQMIQSYTSSDEMILLFYVSISTKRFKRSFELFRKYNLFAILKEQHFATKEHLDFI